MLILFTFSLTSLLLLSSSVLVWPVLCLTLFLSFLSYYNSLFNSSVTFIQSFSVMDGLSLFIVFLLFFIMYVAYLNSYTFGSFKLISLVFVALTFFCYQVFTTSHLFYLYFFYEASLIPILYIIIK
jgi:NADH:ubiquinone oxidoreductase subunit 4 (subunit M)